MPPHVKGFATVNHQLDKIAFSENLSFHHISRQAAAQIHKELRRQKDKELQRLLQGRMTTKFVYDFLSCKAGHYLDGASTLDGDIPQNAEYVAGGQFYWSGLCIAVVRDSLVPPFQPGSVRGICIFHDAYLSSYPGPNEFFHKVDPRLTRFNVEAHAVVTTPRKESKDRGHRRRNRTPTRLGKAQKNSNVFSASKSRRLSGDLRDEFYDDPSGRILDAAAAHNAGIGSRSWCDVPVLAGSGVGRLLLAHCMQLRCGYRIASEGMVAKKWRRRLSSQIPMNFMISVAGGVTNARMLSLLDAFGFKRLYMTHPQTGEPWKDEAGDDLYVMTRAGPLDRSTVSQALKRFVKRKSFF